MDGNLIETSLNILLKTILQTYFQNIQCIIQSSINTTDQNYSNLQIPVPFYSETPFVIDPLNCIPGCFHYILYDPDDTQPSWINQCIQQNSVYKFKAIIVLENKQIEMYIGKAYAADAIFIIQTPNSEYFTIAAFEDIEVTKIIIINHWCIKTNTFLVTQNNASFFNDKKPSSKQSIFVLLRLTEIPVYMLEPKRNEYFGSNYHILAEFVKANNFKIITRLYSILLPLHKQKYKANEIAFIVTLDGIYKPGVVYSAPMTGIEISFMVPRPRMYNYWLQLLKVFRPTMWILIILTYLVIGTYFWIVRKYIRNDQLPKFKSVIYFFLQQGFDSLEVPISIRSRFIFGMLLILGLLYGSLFSSMITSKLISPSYLRVISTMEDLASTDLYVSIERSLEFLTNKEHLTKSERLIFTEERITYPSTDAYMRDTLNQTAMANTLTELRIYKSVTDSHMFMKESFHRVYSKYELKSTNPLYIHLVPKLNNYILRCKAAGLDIIWEWQFTRYVYRKKPSVAFEEYHLSYQAARTELGLVHLRPAFFFLFVGIGVGVVVFCTEHLIYALKLSVFF